MKKILLDISFLGSAYCGWQVQPNAVSVQEKIQEAAQKIFGVKTNVTGCSRTDSGVHAKSFICMLEPTQGANDIPLKKIPNAINAQLPPDIAVKSAEEATPDFHPRYSAHSKEYEYIICNSPVRDPLFHGRSAFIPQRLDETLMQKAADYIVGTHDFASFMASGSKITDTVRNVFYCKTQRTENCVKIKICANGFLYNMVRIIAGTLVDIGLGKYPPEQTEKIIKLKNRSFAGKTMPACGLYLSKVFYPASSRKE